ncbi:MAG: GntR family transcriptional regulator [Bacteroides sp.]|nr:GntR family transcriptional regulator [Bacteroides sp.]
MKFKESKSIYLQIADRICDEILQGQYREEERIPSVREYAATVEVNANTVVRSFDYLQGQDIIYNKRGLGYFVSQGARQCILDLRKEVFLRDDLPEFFRQLKTLDIPLKEVEKMYKDYLVK